MKTVAIALCLFGAIYFGIQILLNMWGSMIAGLSPREDVLVNGKRRISFSLALMMGESFFITAFYDILLKESPVALAWG